MTTIPINYIEIRDGKPRIAGKRMTVQEIVAMHLLNQQPIDWIVENYDLTAAEIHTALAYYYDHHAEIDQSLENLAAQAKRSTPALDEVIVRLKSHT